MLAETGARRLGVGRDGPQRPLLSSMKPRRAQPRKGRFRRDRWAAPLVGAAACPPRAGSPCLLPPALARSVSLGGRGAKGQEGLSLCARAQTAAGTLLLPPASRGGSRLRGPLPREKEPLGVVALRVGAPCREPRAGRGRRLSRAAWRGGAHDDGAPRDSGAALPLAGALGSRLPPAPVGLSPVPTKPAFSPADGRGTQGAGEASLRGAQKKRGGLGVHARSRAPRLIASKRIADDLPA